MFMSMLGVDLGRRTESASKSRTKELKGPQADSNRSDRVTPNPVQWLETLDIPLHDRFSIEICIRIDARILQSFHDCLNAIVIYHL